MHGVPLAQPLACNNGKCAKKNFLSWLQCFNCQAFMFAFGSVDEIALLATQVSHLTLVELHIYNSTFSRLQHYCGLSKSAPFLNCYSHGTQAQFLRV